MSLPAASASEPDQPKAMVGWWLRSYASEVRIIAVSFLLLVPCFWHRNLEAGDLASHTYNAWLADLIPQGRAPGLYLARQYNNVLLDIPLTALGRKIGFIVAEKLLVSVSVLVFFWGCFAFIAMIAGESPWLISPCLAMVAYGWAFEMGFINYYLSVGLAFAAVSLVAKKGTWRYVSTSGLAIFVYLAHPIGFLWFVAGTLYVCAAQRLPETLRKLLFPAALAAVLFLHLYTSHHYKTHDPVGWRFFRFNGSDQFVLYSWRYRIFAILLPLTAAAAFLVAIRHEAQNREFWHRLRMPFELWAVLLFAAAMLWEGITVPAYAMGVTFLPERITSITAVLGLSLISCLRPRKWFFAAFAGMAAVFFYWVYLDTGTLNQMQEDTQALINTLPTGTRVVATTLSLPGSRVAALQLVARPCVGKCFDYSNYEPSTRQFRVRTAEKNSFVVSNAIDGLAMREGRYVIREDDPPLMQIYQCDPRDFTRLCSRELLTGESTNSIGEHHEPQPQ